MKRSHAIILGVLFATLGFHAELRAQMADDALADFARITAERRKDARNEASRRCAAARHGTERAIRKLFAVEEYAPEGEKRVLYWKMLAAKCVLEVGGPPVDALVRDLREECATAQKGYEAIEPWLSHPEVKRVESPYIAESKTYTKLCLELSTAPPAQIPSILIRYYVRSPEELNEVLIPASEKLEVAMPLFEGVLKKAESVRSIVDTQHEAGVIDVASKHFGHADVNVCIEKAHRVFPQIFVKPPSFSFREAEQCLENVRAERIAISKKFREEQESAKWSLLWYAVPVSMLLILLAGLVYRAVASSRDVEIDPDDRF